MSEIEKYYNGEIIVDFEEETELEKKYNEVAELYSEAVKKKIEYRKEIKRLKERIEYLERSNNRREDEILELRKENADLDNIINELEKDFERKIQSCTIEAETTTNDFYCRLHIATLKKWLNKLQELKGDGSND